MLRFNDIDPKVMGSLETKLALKVGSLVERLTGLKLVNILELGKVGIKWQEVSGMRYYVRIGMLSLQTHFDTPSCFPDSASNYWTLARRKLLGQFVEVHKI